jgi:hypothetical protein
MLREVEAHYHAVWLMAFKGDGIFLGKLTYRGEYAMV